jgi:predicted permease
MGEVAMSVVLLAGAGLLFKTFDNLRSLNPGFSPDEAWTASISLHDARYPTSESVNRLFEQSLSRIREMPGIELAAVSLRLPYERGLNIPFRIVEKAEAHGPMTLTNLSYVTEDYFKSLAIPLIQGRRFDTRDRFDTQRVTIVNRAFVEKYLPNQAPLGLHIETGNESREIVAVVGDVNQRQSGWGNYGPIDRIPSVYIPARQATDAFLELVHTWFAPSWIVRTTLPGSAVIDGLQRSVKAVDPYLPFAGFSGMNDVIARSLAQQRIQATLLAILAGIALFLAVIGVYGLVSRSVTERSREMGIRLALGATQIQSLGSAAWPGIAMSLLGVSAGSLLAVWSGRVLRGLIWGISPSDPSTIAVVALGLLLIASFASMIPALRLTRLEPSRTLREQ